MSTVASRELRNDTAGVLRRVEEGEDVVITVSGRAVAKLIPFPDKRRTSLPRNEFVRRLTRAQADPGLRDDLDALAGETTDDLGPIQ
jgi:prevent-host-death family protein